MNKIIQEKMQVEARAAPRGPENWVSDKSARDTNMMQPRHPQMGRYQSHADRERFNFLPPGSNIEEQECADIHAQPMAGGLGSGTQATQDVTLESLHKGYDRKRMRPTDDMYSNEHVDAFYYTAEVDGLEGFVERSNTLDRS